jgi:hypothetical protein
MIRTASIAKGSVANTSVLSRVWQLANEYRNADIVQKDT